jgi:phosphate transport system substrate-binding protein
MQRWLVFAVVISVVIIVGSTLGFAFLSSPSSEPDNFHIAQQQKVMINAAGASFPYPLIDSMIAEYTHNVNNNVLVNYQSMGSGGGISALRLKTIDFAASDAPLKASELSEMPNVLHIPETIGAVTLAYNLPDIPTGLNLTGEVIADIFLGKIRIWNDPQIQSLNPGFDLPNKNIHTVHRSDGSGTTYIFTSYLSTISAQWEDEVGKGKSVGWLTGVGAPGNTGVASVIQGNKYMMGYVELSYALENNMTLVAVQNLAGNLILPSLDSIMTAVEAGAAAGLPAGNESWATVSVLNAPGEQSYPIASFTYLLTYKELNVIPGMTLEKATAIVQFLWYVVHDGQQFATELIYAPLPPNVVQVNEVTIQSITFNGQSLPIT